MRFEARDLVFMAMFAALTAALGLLPKVTLPFGVPITAQSLGVMLAGAVLGPKRGFGALALFTALVLMGLPLLAGGRGGLGLLASPTGGFLLGFAPAAALVGWWCARHSHASFLPVFLGAVLGGIGLLYLFGITYWIAVTGSTLSAVMVAMVWFLPGDLIKAVVCAWITVTLWRAYPQAFRS